MALDRRDLRRLFLFVEKLTARTVAGTHKVMRSVTGVMPTGSRTQGSSSSCSCCTRTCTGCGCSSRPSSSLPSRPPRRRSSSCPA
jgi:hypothetical protein